MLRRTDAMPPTPPPTFRWTLPPLRLAVAFFAVYLLFSYYGFFHWTLRYGVLFVAYWLRPRGEWWAYAALAVTASCVHTLMISWHNFHDPLQLFRQSPPLLSFIGNVPQAFIGMVGVHLLLKRGITADKAAGLRQMGALHVAALVNAALFALKDLWYVFTEGQVGDVRRGMIVDMQPVVLPDSIPVLAKFALSHFMGAFLGVMLVVPVALWLLVAANRPGSQRIIRSALIYLYLLPMLLYLGNALLTDPGGGVAAMLRILLLAAVVVFSFLHGWRGAALSVAVVSGLIALDDHLRGGTADILEMQLYVAVMGAMALLFGASVDELRQKERLLKADRDHLQEALAALAESSRRSLHSEELERKRLARELHDEMGQTLTAMQAQLSLGRLRADGGDRREGNQLMEQLTQRLGRSLRSVVNALTPDELDQLGLYTAITYGSPAQLCEHAGVAYASEIYGDGQLLERLDMLTNLAAYRIVQEAVNNALKHGYCQQVRVRLRIGERNRRILLVLDIRDDGIGLKSLRQIEHGFHSIRDRAAALNGVLHIQNLPGVRVHVLLRQ